MSDLGGQGAKPGRKMSDAERWLRDAEIVAELYAGAKVADVARAHDLTATHVRRILKAFDGRRTALEVRPMEIVERVLRIYEEQLVSFAKVARDTIERAPAVAIAALKGRADALERYVQLLGDLGKLPANLELFRAEDELTQIVTRVSDLLEEAAQGAVTPAEVQAELGRMIGLPSWDAEGESTELGPGENDG